MLSIPRRAPRPGRPRLRERRWCHGGAGSLQVRRREPSHWLLSWRLRGCLRCRAPLWLRPVWHAPSALVLSVLL